MSIRSFIANVVRGASRNAIAGYIAQSTVTNPGAQLGAVAGGKVTTPNGVTTGAIVGGNPGAVDSTIPINTTTSLVNHPSNPTIMIDGATKGYFILKQQNLDLTYSFWVRPLLSPTLYPINISAVCGQIQNIDGFVLQTVKFSPNGKHILVGGFTGTGTNVLTCQWGIMQNWSLIANPTPAINAIIVRGSSTIQESSLTAAPAPAAPGNPGTYTQTVSGGNPIFTWTWEAVTDPVILHNLPASTFLTITNPAYGFFNDSLGNPVVNVSGVYESTVNTFSCFNLMEYDEFSLTHPASTPPFGCGTPPVTTTCTLTINNDTGYSLGAVMGAHLTVTGSFHDVINVSGTVSDGCTTPPGFLSCGNNSNVSGTTTTVVSAFPVPVGAGQINIDNAFKIGPCSLLNSNVSEGLFVARNLQSGMTVVSDLTRNFTFGNTLGPNPHGGFVGYTTTGGYVTTFNTDDGGHQSDLNVTFQSKAGATVNASNIINITENTDLVLYWKPFMHTPPIEFGVFDVFTDTHRFLSSTTSDWATLNLGVKATDSESFLGAKGDAGNSYIRTYAYNSNTSEIINTSQLKGIAIILLVQDFCIKNG